jgi:hypothetical protein
LGLQTTGGSLVLPEAPLTPGDTYVVSVAGSTSDGSALTGARVRLGDTNVLTYPGTPNSSLNNNRFSFPSYTVPDTGTSFTLTANVSRDGSNWTANNADCTVTYPIEPPESDTLVCEELTNSPDPERGNEVTWSCVATANSNIANFAQFRMWRGDTQIDSGSSTVSNNGVGSWTTTTPSEDGSYRVECRLCEDQAGANCTQWGVSN